METIFFAFFETGIYQGSNTTHDRVAYYPGPKTLKNFFDWLDTERTAIENATGRNVVVKNFKIERIGY